MLCIKNNKLLINKNKLTTAFSKSSFWKACTPYLETEFGSVGGDIEITTELRNGSEKQTEYVSNLLYCAVDNYTLNAMKQEDYLIPIKNNEDGDYTYIKPISVGDKTQHYILNNDSYRIGNKVYYITTIDRGDLFFGFTAPFNIENIYVVESYSELELEKTPIIDGKTKRYSISTEQGKHNADLISFITQSIVTNQNKDFNTICDEWLNWAKLKDTESGLYKNGTYDLRGIYKLTNYTGSNWNTANYYLNHITKSMLKSDGSYKVSSENVLPENNVLLKKGETYTIMFPYCTGCYDDEELEHNWDYWSGKLLIFESTEGPHLINGGNSIGTITTKTMNENNKVVYNTEYNKHQFKNNTNDPASVSGNSTLAEMKTDQSNLYILNNGKFIPINSNNYDDDGNKILTSIQPTEIFLYE